MPIGHGTLREHGAGQTPSRSAPLSERGFASDQVVR